MSLDNAAPFPLGSTVDATNLPTTNQFLGKTYQFKDPYTGGYNTYRCVENESGIALAPKRVVIYKSGSEKKEVDGYGYVAPNRGAGIVDENLPSTGAPDGHLFWILVKGRGIAKTALGADARNVFNVDTPAVAATAATSQAATAGYVGAPDLTGATAVLAAQIYNQFGRAMSAKTTANTGVEILLDVDFERV
jgi:hypothetical protein